MLIVQRSFAPTEQHRAEHLELEGEPGNNGLASLYQADAALRQEGFSADVLEYEEEQVIERLRLHEL